MKKIIIFIIVIMALTLETFAESRLNLSIQNRAISGTTYSADIYVNVNNTLIRWLSASSTIVLQYNSSGLNLTGLDGVAVQNFDSQLSGAGYSASQTDFGTGYLAVNLVTTNPSVLKNGYFKLCTVRWNITNAAQMDNLQFNSSQTELYNGTLTQLNYGCNDSTCYSFTNPTPQMLQVNSPRMIFSLENRTISGSTLYADLKVSIPSESSPWLVAASTIVIKYNALALNLSGLDGVSIQNFDTQLSSAGYTASQTDFGTGFLALNLVTINPSVSKIDTFMLGTLRWNIIDNTKKDSLKFDSGTSEIYNGTLTQLNHGCNVPSCYQTADPTPMDLSPAFTAPTLTAPSNNATGVSIAPTLTWNAVATATSYRVQVSTSSSFGSLLTNDVVATTSKALSGLANTTTYYWRVCAKVASDSSSWSAVWSFTTVFAAPEIPILATPTNGSTGLPLSTTLTWNTAANATIYRLQVSTSNTFTTFLVNDMVPTTSKAINGLSNNTTYYWRVMSKHTSDSSNWSTVWSFTTTQSSTPLPPSWAVIGQTGYNATIGFMPAGHYKIGTRSLTTGDAIGVFYTDNGIQKCGGYFVWDGLNFGIVAWGDDSFTTTIKEGFAGNEHYIFKIWDSQALQTYDAVRKFVSGPEVFVDDAFSIVDTVIAITSVTQTIPLTSGWNMISVNVSPSNPAMSNILSPLGVSMQIAKNAYGNLYAPPFQTSLSTWNILHAYQLRMSVSGTLEVTGIRITPESTPISLGITGVYWLPYLRSSGMATTTALASINGNYLQIKSMQGLVYQPPFFNTLTQLQPNYGYTIRMTQSAILTYPANTAPKSASADNAIIKEPQVFAREKQITGKTAVIAMELQNVGDGDEIGVFTLDGMLVGSSVWQEGCHGVVVWGDDEYTTEKDGATEGEELTVKIWSNATKNIGRVSQISLNDMTANSQSFTLTYETDAVHLLKAVAEVSEEAGLSVSPQPASNEVFVEIPYQEDLDNTNIEIKLFNQAGQLALGVESVTYDKVIKMNTSNLSSGFYQLILNINGKTYNEKVVVVK